MLRTNVASLLLAASAGAVLLPACSRKPTDEAQIRSLFVEAAHSAEERRVNDVMRDVSDSFEGQGLDRRGVKQVVALHVLRGSWNAVTISGDRIAVHGDGADAVVDVVMLRSGKGRAIAELLPEQATVHRFWLKLKREPDGWKVTSATWRPISLGDAVAGPGGAAP